MRGSVTVTSPLWALTTALPAPAGGASFPYQVFNTVVLSELAEEDVWTGDVYYERVEDPRLTVANGGVPVFTDRIIRPARFHLDLVLDGRVFGLSALSAQLWHLQ